MRLLVKWLVCCGSLLLALTLFPQWVTVSGGWPVMVGAGTVLWLINIFIRPAAQFVSILITLLTLGIFSAIVNAGMVCLADLLVRGIEIRSFWICIFISLVITAGNLIFVPKKS